MNWIDLFDFGRHLVELFFYFIVGPLLSIFAIKKLKEMKVSKISTRIDSQKEAFRIAAEQFSMFNNRIIPLYKHLMLESFEKNINLQKSLNVETDDKRVTLKLISKLNQTDIDQINESIYLSDLINSLEEYSMYFISGVASSDLGFIANGQNYCKLVKEVLPFIATEFKKGRYKNIYLLYINWNRRLKNEKLKLEIGEIEKEVLN